MVTRDFRDRRLDDINAWSVFCAKRTVDIASAHKKTAVGRFEHPPNHHLEKHDVALKFVGFRCSVRCVQMRRRYELKHVQQKKVTAQHQPTHSQLWLDRQHRAA